MIYKIKQSIKLLILKIRWRKINKHNFTIPATFFPIHSVKVGKYTYGALNVHNWGTINEHLIIGAFVSIADGVHFLLGGNHNYNTLTTYPFKVMVMGQIREAISKGPVIINDDVWIGRDALILSGITIGQGAIVAARSVVTTNIPPYAIVAGNPARIIKYRFDVKIVNKLMKLNFAKIDKSYINRNINKLYQNVNEELLNDTAFKEISDIIY